MPSQVNTFFTLCFGWVFCCFLAVHFAYVKTPSQYRGIASDKKIATPWYDASFKL